MIAVAILAAGKGTRMKSKLPKVLHQLGEKTLVERVLDSVADLDPVKRMVIVGYRSDKVRESLSHDPTLEFVEQREQLGTGHAVQQVIPLMAGFEGDLLVLNGDVPLLRPETLAKLLQIHREKQNAATILTAQLPNPKGYGRVFCDHNHVLQQIVEDRDCTDAQRQNCRINAGVYCFRWQDLSQVLPNLTPENDQNEYYLTDAVTHLSPIMAVDADDYQEIMGINDRLQMATANQILQARIKNYWMAEGVTLIQPETITIGDRVQLAPDVVIEPSTHLRGQTSIGAKSRIGPGSLIENSQIGENVSVLFSVVRDSTIASHTEVGPYAHLRGKAQVGEGCRVGNFVEIKKSCLGTETKVAHLSYIGDATLGNRVNIAAGTITANYDGVNKHQTIIGDRSKTGANSVLVAPLTLGTGVTVAAGTTVTKDVQDDALVVARTRQTVMPGWRLKSQKL